MDMMNAVKSVLADVSSVSLPSEKRGDCGLGETSYRVRAYLHLRKHFSRSKVMNIDHKVKTNLKQDCHSTVYSGFRSKFAWSNCKRVCTIV